MKNFTRYFGAIVLSHFAVATVHGVAHQRLLIGLSSSQQLFIIIVIVLAPLLAMMLGWTRLRRIAAGLLFLSMLGSLIFGVINHYLIRSPDHVSHLPSGEWAVVFQVTALLLVITELLGCLIALAGLRSSHR